MKWIESIKEIRKARDEDRLVIFVGSGVSANSEVPTWSRLIKEIAKNIEYEKCSECIKYLRYTDKYNCHDGCKCAISESGKGECTCKDRYNFTPDEYLRIPEYFYKKCEDDSKCKNSKECNKDKKHEKYYSFIKEVLLPEGSSFKPNAIDDIIFDILPDHIITTNYDSLLEDSESVNAGMYTVISDDKELINNAGKNYIIKMHGTFDKPESIILKESDYIEYDHTHPLISTFIKGILVNHSFLFVGYSLNDYNLRLIMGWINYYRKQYNSKSEKVKHFVVNTEKVSDYEVKRLSDNNIEVIDLTSMSDDAKNDSEAKEKLSGEKGRLLYTYLSCIEDDIKFEKYCEVKDFFLNKCEVLKSYRKINIGDFNAVYNLGHENIEGTGLVFDSFLRPEKIEKISELLKDKDKRIVDVFQRSRITHVEYIDPFMSKTRSIYRAIPDKKSDYSVIVNDRKLAIDKAFRLYLDNDYIALCDYADKTEDLDERIYYYTILGKQTDEIRKEIDDGKYGVKERDYVDIMLHKVREYFALYNIFNNRSQKTDKLKKYFDRAPRRYAKAMQYLRGISEVNTIETSKMADLLEEHKDKYREGKDQNFAFYYLKKIQGYAYNYYFFIKDNLLPLDIYNNPEKYLRYYIEAILASNTPNTGQNRVDLLGWTLYTDLRPYYLNEIDLDMLVKFINPKDLKNNISNYYVQSLHVEESVDVVKKYINLCNSFAIYDKGMMRKHGVNLENKLQNFSIIISLLDLEDAYKIIILKNCFNVFKQQILKYGINGTGTFAALLYLINNLKVDGAHELLGEILDFLVEKYDFMWPIFNDILSQMIFKLSPYVKCSTIDKVKTAINKLKTDEVKIPKIYSFRYLLPMEEYQSYLNERVELINNTRMLFNFTNEGHIESKNKAIKIIADNIKKEIDEEKLSGSEKFPSEYKTQVKYFVLLKTRYPQIDISILEPYAEYSPYLQFVFDPEKFDYSKVNTSDPTWAEIVSSKQYRKYFIKHKKEILSDNLKNIFETERDNRAQQKIVYGVLLDEDEIWDFPEEKWEIKN